MKMTVAYKSLTTMYLYLVPFAYLFPEQGLAETRVITTHGYPSLPDDEYALVEYYCVDPTCDCRRVLLNVLPRRQMDKGYLAAISFGFDREAELAGPFLDPLNPQSKYAQVLLDLVITRVLEADPAYIARLEAHYRQVKQAVADPTHPAQRLLAQLEAKDKKQPRRKTRARRR
jgi:hypothetical protein